MENLKKLYKSLFGVSPVNIEVLPQSGSSRRYYRLYSPSGIEPASVIGVYGNSSEENKAFIYLSRHFHERQLPVPEILAVSEESRYYLQTDLGRTSLYDALAKGRNLGGRYNLKEKQLLRSTMAILPEFQVIGASGLDFNICYPQPEFDRTNVLFDLNYFKYCFLKPLEIEFNEIKLEAVFQRMANELATGNDDTFMYRDFQARNIMLTDDGKPYFIDFQGGRKGPMEYDVVSFLWQASARYRQSLRDELINVYIDNIKLYRDFNESQFRQNIKQFVLFRLLQVLGAYGFRGLCEHKQYFIDSIPPAIANLKAALKDGCCQSAYLYDLLERITLLPQFQEKPAEIKAREDGYKTTSSSLYKPNPIDGMATFSKYDGKGPLVVQVYSFSFHKGIPADDSGNGGGYVFDCRSTHNPGRYEPYKKLTGLDEPVIRFLEDDGEILTFLDSVYKLADHHVERFMERGFTHLMFSFGCTGGQHRSVYSAEHLAHHIHKKYGIEVHICHREQNISNILFAQKQ